MPPNGPGTTRPCILVVDDSAPVRGLIRTILQAGGYEVLEAASVVEAFEAADAALRGPDVIMADLHIPGGSGFDAVEVVRRIRPEAKALFMSGDEIGPALPEGASFLAKPFSPDTLLLAIAKLTR